MVTTNGQSSPNEPFPLDSNSDKSVVQHGFQITTRKLPILKAGPIDHMTAKLGIAPPEMIFGDNIALIEHLESGWKIEFNAFDALDLVDKTGNSMLQVAHSKEWQSTREKKHEGITEVVKPFDWSYSTGYKGTEQSKSKAFEPSDTPIPLELLKRPDPIIFFDEVMLYEDEMADNGITLLSCKLRVMPARLLLLCRFFMRLDGVMLRIRDTRIYVEFQTGEVIREYTAREDKYEVVRQKLAMQGRDAPAQLRDANIPAAPAASKYIPSAAAPSSSSTKPPPPHPHIPKLPATAAPAPSPKESAEPDSKSETAVPASIQLAAELRKRATSVTETYIAYSVCEKLIKECAMQADYSIPQRKEKDGVVPKGADGEDLGVGTGWWYEDLGLAPTFSTWAQITFLHMYILTVRLRAFPATHAPSWHQHLLDHFFYAAEDRLVRDHNIQARSLRNKYLKDLFTQWRGLLAGYDEGLVKGDAVLATAVWRNVFGGKEDVDLVGLGEVVSYMRGVLKGLDGMEDEVVAEGEIQFGDPRSQRKVVEMRSKMMDTLLPEEGLDVSKK
ncbi:MAG: hypothetical protein LQ339_001389 [Xanthoria mediterranea]|nr:MAG: hypothetical protein LQ339_001389 [Xanthoria mediterranea]